MKEVENLRHFVFVEHFDISIGNMQELIEGETTACGIKLM